MEKCYLDGRTCVGARFSFCRNAPRCPDKDGAAIDAAREFIRARRARRRALGYADGHKERAEYDALTPAVKNAVDVLCETGEIR
jgi:hypothetical protein